MVLALLVSGCQALSQNTDLNVQQDGLTELAADAYAEGEFYRAKKLVQKALEANPDDADAESLMVEILSAEISRQKAAFSDRVPEEFSESDNEDLARTWNERAEMFLTAERYTEALEAAEKVFIYEPENIRASELIDKIRGQARSEGKEEMLVKQGMYRDEINERISRYIRQAGEQFADGRWAQAKLSVEKALLLAPENIEAKRLYQRISTDMAGR